MKVEITEDEFKKVIVMLKGTKRLIKWPQPTDLKLYNTWRVAEKMADTMLRRAGSHVEKSTTGKIIVKKDD